MPRNAGTRSPNGLAAFKAVAPRAGTYRGAPARNCRTGSAQDQDSARQAAPPRHAVGSPDIDIAALALAAPDMVALGPSPSIAASAPWGAPSPTERQNLALPAAAAPLVPDTAQPAPASGRPQVEPHHAGDPNERRPSSPPSAGD